MRVFAVILALAVLSGCHARSVPEANWKNPWEITVDELKEYLTDLSSKADEVVKDIRSSQISRELDTLIQDSMSELAVYKDDLQTRVAPYTQEAAERLGKDLQLLVDKLRDRLTEAREQMDKYSQELKTVMEQNVDDVTVRVSAYTRKLKKRLNKDTQEIKRHVADYFEELQSRTSDNMEEMKTRLNPYFVQVRDNAQAKITTLNDLLKSQVDGMKDKIQTTAEDIKEKFEQTAEDMQFSLEEKMEEVRIWFQPFIAMINTHIVAQ